MVHAHVPDDRSPPLAGRAAVLGALHQNLTEAIALDTLQAYLPSKLLFAASLLRHFWVKPLSHHALDDKWITAQMDLFRKRQLMATKRRVCTATHPQNKHPRQRTQRQPPTSLSAST